jgi:hypothetical protein
MEENLPFPLFLPQVERLYLAFSSPITYIPPLVSIFYCNVSSGMNPK